MTRIAYWKLCEKFGLHRNEKWYELDAQLGTENKQVKLLWDVNIQGDHIIEARRTDIVVVDKVDKNCLIVNVAIPVDVRAHEKQQENVEKYQDLRREIK